MDEELKAEADYFASLKYGDQFSQERYAAYLRAIVYLAFELLKRRK